NGSSFFMRGNSSIKECDDLRGPNYSLIVIDECQSQEKRLKYLVQDICEPMLLKQNGRLIMSGTAPRIPGTYWEERWDQSSLAHRYNFNISDNPYIPNYQEKLQDILKEKGWKETNSTFQREYLGKVIYDTDAMVFRLTEQNYYTDEDLKTWIARQYSKNDIEFVCGIDWGFEDYSTLALIMYSVSSPEMFVIREIKIHRESITDFATKVNQMLDSFDAQFGSFPNKYFNTYADPAGAGKLINAELNTLIPRLSIRSAIKTDKDLGIEQLQELVNKGLLKVKKDSLVADECRKIVWKKNEQSETYVREIDDDYYHPELMMAVLYSLRTLLKYPLDHKAIAKERQGSSDNRTNEILATVADIIQMKQEQATQVPRGGDSLVILMSAFQ
ncbi:MAG TPA: hypothetical protein VMD05_05655, partial [Candidatus Nanoarchaeia archaeon]|nr:hypothetical protein [Candidatus Nanoarchaeia archaeon]